MKILKEKIDELIHEFNIYHTDLDPQTEFDTKELIHRITNTYEEELIKSLRCPNCVGKLQLTNIEDENEKIASTEAKCKNCGETIML